MDEVTRKQLDEAEAESGELDFKSTFDPGSPQDWCELIKDIIAMANSGGGLIVVGINDDGSPATDDLEPLLTLDPAKIVDKIKKYTSQQLTCCSLVRCSRRGHDVALLSIKAVAIPIVFTAPGTYDIGGGKQKTAFSLGTVYFRHGPKSEPGTSDDLRGALDRELSRIRSSWLDGIQKVVTAPVDAEIKVIPADVRLTQEDEATRVRLVPDESAPAFKAMRTDVLYPYRQKELVRRVNKLLGGTKITPHDIFCVRKAHGIDGQANFFYKPQFSSPQYSETFAQWIVEQHHVDSNFFLKAREACRKRST